MELWPHLRLLVILIYISLLYNYEYYWRNYGLQEIWTQQNEEVSTVHQSVSYWGASLVCILPALHARTRAGTTCKVGTKRKVFKKGKLTQTSGPASNVCRRKTKRTTTKRCKNISSGVHKYRADNIRYFIVD